MTGFGQEEAATVARSRSCARSAVLILVVPSVSLADLPH
jgi:hypothetical protein